MDGRGAGHAVAQIGVPCAAALRWTGRAHVYTHIYTHIYTNVHGYRVGNMVGKIVRASVHIGPNASTGHIPSSVELQRITHRYWTRVLDMCIDVCIDMCIDMCLGMCMRLMREGKQDQRRESLAPRTWRAFFFVATRV